MEHCPPSAWNRVRHRVEYAPGRASSNRQTPTPPRSRSPDRWRRRLQKNPVHGCFLTSLLNASINPTTGCSRTSSSASKTSCISLPKTSSHPPGCRRKAGRPAAAQRRARAGGFCASAQNVAQAAQAPLTAVFAPAHRAAGPSRHQRLPAARVGERPSRWLAGHGHAMHQSANAM